MKLPAGTNRERWLIVANVGLLVGLLFFKVVIDPQLQTRKNLTEQVDQLQLNLTKMKRDMHVKDRVDKLYLDIEPLIRTTGNDQQEISLFTRELNDLYTQFPVKICSVKIYPVLRNEFYRQLMVNLEMSGNIKDILHFLRAVEASARPFKIEELTFTAQEAVDRIQAVFLISKVVTQGKNVITSVTKGQK